jgi:Protein of unknown function (DUF3545)
MNNKYWDEMDILDDEGELTRPDKKGKTKGSDRKRKWREIESIKEQRRLRRDLAYFEQNAY